MRKGKAPLPVAVRIRRSLVPDGECMVWAGHRNRKGYGMVRVGRHGIDRTNREAHLAWWLAHGREIPTGKELDHLCRNRACVRLDHLEAVTHRENVLRGASPAARQARQTHCKHGHRLDEKNTWVSVERKRHCRICHRDRERERRARAVTA